MNNIIKIKNMSVVLDGNFKALDKINLDLPSGKIIGFIGPSGAGKTTLIRTIVGRLKVNSGSVDVLSKPAGSASLRSEMSYMTQELSVYPDLTVKENLKYFVRMLNQPKSQHDTTINDVLRSVDLTEKSNSLVGKLSSGQKQRVSLAVALIGKPKLMVLDEPTVGLDPVLRENLWRLFAELADSGVTLIVSSHSMDEATRCDDLVLIRDGKVIAHDTPAELRRKTDTKTIRQSFLKLVGEKS
jgi:ABC-2 type transport system ATP-binding protein